MQWGNTSHFSADHNSAGADGPHRKRTVCVSTFLVSSECSTVCGTTSDQWELTCILELGRSPVSCAWIHHITYSARSGRCLLPLLWRCSSLYSRGQVTDLTVAVCRGITSLHSFSDTLSRHVLLPRALWVFVDVCLNASDLFMFESRGHFAALEGTPSSINSKQPQRHLQRSMQTWVNARIWLGLTKHLERSCSFENSECKPMCTDRQES